MDITKIVTISLVLLALVALGYFMTVDPTADFYQFEPGMDNRPEGMLASDAVIIGDLFQAFDGQPSEIKSRWPRFRGEDFDNISKEKVRLADSWSDGGPQKLWSVDLGEGHSGPVVYDGRVYILDYDETERADMLRCFSLDDGREIWRRGYDVYIKRNHGMSRTTPAVANGYVVTIGPMCHVMCVSADSGQFKWGIDIEREYESEVPLWYTGQCPLIDDSLAVIATGGKALLIGVHLETGEVVWQTPNPDNWAMSHSSVIPMSFFGHKMYVYSSLGGLVGVSADSASRGEVLFKSTEWRPNVIAPSPLKIDNDKIFVTAGYGAGSMLFRVHYENGRFDLELLQSYKPDGGIASEQQTPILFKDHLFTILPKDAGPHRNQFVCSSAADPSTILWASAKDVRFGLGPYLLADGKFFIMSDEGELTMAKATTSGFELLGQARVLNGHDAWGPMAIAAGRLLCRDSRTMICLDLRAGG